MNVSSANEAALGYAPLLLALDDGSRCGTCSINKGMGRFVLLFPCTKMCGAFVDVIGTFWYVLEYLLTFTFARGHERLESV